MKISPDTDICVVRKMDGRFDSLQIKAANRLTVAQIAKTLKTPRFPESEAPKSKASLIMSKLDTLPPNFESQLRMVGITEKIPSFVLQILVKINCFLIKNFNIGLFMPEPQASLMIYDLSDTVITDMNLCHNEFCDGITYSIINNYELKAIEVDGKVEVRPVCKINQCVDHRYLDGSDGFLFLRKFSEVLANFKNLF